jgi:hypothetical protein
MENSKVSKIICEKHGDISDTAFHINYVDNSSGRGILKNKVYCLECITEFLDTLKLPKITQQPQEHTEQSS